MNHSELPKDNSMEDRILGIKALANQSGLAELKPSLEEKIISDSIEVIKNAEDKKQEIQNDFQTNISITPTDRLEKLNKSLLTLNQRKSSVLKKLEKLFKQVRNKEYLEKVKKEN